MDGDVQGCEQHPMEQIEEPMAHGADVDFVDGEADMEILNEASPRRDQFLNLD